MTLIVHVNQDINCPVCGQPGAILARQTSEKREYGACLKCIERRLRMIIGEQTMTRVAQDITNWLHNETSNIDVAYQEAGNDLNIAISVKFNTDKYGKHRFKARGKFSTGHIVFESDGDVNEAQQQLPGMD